MRGTTLFFNFLFLFLGGGERGASGERRRERETLKQTPRSVQSLTRGLVPRPRDHDLSQSRVGCLTGRATQTPPIFSPILPFLEQFQGYAELRP